MADTNTDSITSYIDVIGGALGGILGGSAQIISATNGNQTIPQGGTAVYYQNPASGTSGGSSGSNSSTSNKSMIFLILGVLAVLVIIGLVIYSMKKSK